MNRRWNLTLLVGSALALAGCGYDPYPTPKPVRSPIGDSPFVVQRANYDGLNNGQVAHVSAVAPVVRVERPAVAIIKPYEEWSEKEAAADALGRIGAPAIPYLQQALRSPDSEMKKQAAEVLARMGSDAKPAVNDLIVLLNDADPEVRKVAVRTLGRIGPDAAAAVPALMQSLIEQQPAPPSLVPPALNPTFQTPTPTINVPEPLPPATFPNPATDSLAPNSPAPLPLPPNN
ncbi:HEAT repeat domain-containing protein [Anatilimnocola floriformis]|uniref:HEAT repeat domain-containing protein n=1 Tax=Anatilimnocola floriformis TaxID=2948575 RepID=UPI0020C59A57|nr:HEAT repeat domain-containing protein [Anatilimnocola floriformis]